jgi:hypothetical protein
MGELLLLLPPLKERCQRCKVRPRSVPGKTRRCLVCQAELRRAARREAAELKALAGVDGNAAHLLRLRASGRRFD